MSFRLLSKGPHHAAHPQDHLGYPHNTASGPVLRLCYLLGKPPMMKGSAAVEALGSLANEHRLKLFRLLVQAGQSGMAAGALAEALSVPNSSLSFHLAHLNRAGLIEQRREGRSLIYTANYPAMNDLVGYLMENCCKGADCGTDAARQPTPERKTA